MNAVHTVHGVIESIDTTAGTITLLSGGTGKSLVRLGTRAKIMKGDQEIPLADLRKGQKLSAHASTSDVGPTQLAESVRVVEE